MIKIERDNAVLQIDEKDLAQYEARGYNKFGATKKVAPEKLEKEVAKLTKQVEELTEKNTEITKVNEELTKQVEELTKKVK